MGGGGGYGGIKKLVKCGPLPVSRKNKPQKTNYVRAMQVFV